MNDGFLKFKLFSLSWLLITLIMTLFHAIIFSIIAVFEGDPIAFTLVRIFSQPLFLFWDVVFALFTTSLVLCSDNCKEFKALIEDAKAMDMKE